MPNCWPIAKPVNLFQSQLTSFETGHAVHVYQILVWPAIPNFSAAGSCKEKLGLDVLVERCRRIKQKHYAKVTQLSTHATEWGTDSIWLLLCIHLEFYCMFMYVCMYKLDDLIVVLLRYWCRLLRACSLGWNQTLKLLNWRIYGWGKPFVCQIYRYYLICVCVLLYVCVCVFVCLCAHKLVNASSLDNSFKMFCVRVEGFD